jgi:hypothetical protein
VRIKRLLAAAIFLIGTTAATAGIQHKTPVDDDGRCSSGEIWCETTPEWVETLPNGTIVVHAEHTECWCAN